MGPFHHDYIETIPFVAPFYFELFEYLSSRQVMTLDKELVDFPFRSYKAYLSSRSIFSISVKRT